MKLLVCDKLAESAVNQLKEIPGLEVTVKTGMTPEELIKVVPDFNIAIVRSATKFKAEILEHSTNMKLIIRGGVGLDNIDVKKAESMGIMVRNTPTASSASVAELAMGMMFVIARDLYNTTRTCKEGKWEKKRFVGFELGGKTLGIIGIGRIGQELARMANGIGMKVIAHCRNKPCDLPSFVEFTDKDTLLAKSDFVSFHTPFAGTPLCSIEEFKKMKKTAYIVNCARGGVVCEKSLLEALNNGIIAGAAIDVFEKEPTENFELLNHEKVFAACPHVGAQTGEAQDRVGDEVVSIVKEFMK